MRKLKSSILRNSVVFWLFVVVNADDYREDKLIGYSELELTKKIERKKVHSSAENLKMKTEFGTITVILLKETAPEAVQYMKDLVHRDVFKGCGFYRAEPPGPTKDFDDEKEREGYALVQGGANTCGKQESNSLPVEPLIPVEKWTVSLITGTTEFFFSLGDHPDWNGAFTVWGKVKDEESKKTLEEIVALPTRQEKHPSGTVLRILERPVLFEIQLSQPSLDPY